MTKRLIFIAGVEGSGTTALLRILSAPPARASLGGNFLALPGHPDAKRLAKAFGAANQAQWDRTNDLAALLAVRQAARPLHAGPLGRARSYRGCADRDQLP